MTEFRTGYGTAWLDLLASLTGRYLETTRELLPDPEAARRWLAEHDLEPVAPVTEADLEALRALREAVHRTAAASCCGSAGTATAPGSSSTIPAAAAGVPTIGAGCGPASGRTGLDARGNVIRNGGDRPRSGGRCG
jgi:hypothetical protein